MTFLAAPIWNQIAREQALQTKAAMLAFKMTDQQLAQLDDHWMKLEKQAKTPEVVARCLPTCLPLMAEAQAMQNHVAKNPSLQSAIPEINSPEEAVSLMVADWNLNDQDQKTLAQILSQPQPALNRWHQAALRVR
jgi:hypothetical protein